MPMPRIMHLPARIGEVHHTFSKIDLAEEKLGYKAEDSFTGRTPAHLGMLSGPA